ncbi:MAG: hypothetical protein AMJ91_01325 [candidate division Zixibacteria bacterium SM23_73_3]|nr:MAG: hypothetical protein AMJ91_01325 [candidate division Zixibacteria bacterium SM23_73_3]
MQFKKIQNGFMLRLVKGEEVISSLSSFVEKQKISGGFIFGLGAFKDATLGYFDSDNKKYIKRTFPDDLEFSVTGSISYSKGKPFVHVHATAGGPNISTVYFGHLFSATVSATGEFFIIPSDTKIERKTDPETGLNLLDLS